MAGVAMALTGIGTLMQVGGALKQGKMAEKIGKQRAAVDEMRAKQVFENARTEAEIVGEKRNRLIEQNKSQAAASGVSILSPTVDAIEQEVRRTMGLDISSILNKGRQAKTDYLQSAEYERAIGKAKRKQSIWDAIGTGVSGAGSIALMGYDAGIWGSGANRDAYLASKHGIS